MTNAPPIIDQRLVQKNALSQRLIMSSHMQQALHILQIPLQELESFIEEQVSQNPLLEISDTQTKTENELNPPEIENNMEEKDLCIDEHDFTILKQLDDDFREHFSQSENYNIQRSLDEEKQKSFAENSIIAEESLYEQLIHEAHEMLEDQTELKVAEILIGYLDKFGFLKNSTNEIAILHSIEESLILKVLEKIQTFEPYGIGASSIQESMLIQLRCHHKKNSLAYQIIKNSYDDLLHNKMGAIQKKMKCSMEEIQKALEEILHLNIHPGSKFSPSPNQALTADVSLRDENENLFVEVNRDFAPSLRMNKKYLKMLDDPAIAKQTKQFIRHHIFSAKWLVKNLQQRYSTIERIAESLAKRQKDYFLKDDGQLVPLTMKEVAEELEVHESTIARTVSNKYINTPKGLMPLKAFFTTKYTSENGQDLSSKTIRDAILDMIEKENKKKPLSDEIISKSLKDKGIICARRTVAKFRSILNIGNTLQRKKF